MLSSGRGAGGGGTRTLSKMVYSNNFINLNYDLSFPLPVPVEFFVFQSPSSRPFWAQSYDKFDKFVAVKTK